MIYRYPFKVNLIKSSIKPFYDATVKANTPLIFLKEESKLFDPSISLIQVALLEYAIVSILQHPKELTRKDQKILKLITSKVKMEMQTTKKLPGYSVLNTETLELLWISEYDFNYITGYYD
jgi:hypothetical protein